MGGCWGTGAEESQEPMRRLAVIQAMRIAVGFKEMVGFGIYFGSRDSRIC